MKRVRGETGEKGLPFSRGKPRRETGKGDGRTVKKRARRNMSAGKALETIKATEVNSKVTIQPAHNLSTPRPIANAKGQGMTAIREPGARENISNKGEGGGGPRAKKINSEELTEKGRTALEAASRHRYKGIPVLKLKPLRVPPEVGNKGAGRGGEKGAGQGPKGIAIIEGVDVELEHGDQVIHPIHKGREAQNGKADTRATRKATEHPGNKVVLQSKSANHGRGGEEGGGGEGGAKKGEAILPYRTNKRAKDCQPV